MCIQPVALRHASGSRLRQLSDILVTGVHIVSAKGAEKQPVEIGKIAYACKNLGCENDSRMLKHMHSNYIVIN